MSKGIYTIKINGRYYVGKDTMIHNQKRIKEHLLLLEKGKHYNKYLQRAYFKYNKEISCCIVEEHEELSNLDLSILERKNIKKFDSFTNGYNLTLGGEGMSGYTWSEEQKKRSSERIRGEKNHQSKITKEEFLEIVELLKTGKSNKFIGELFNLHNRYVSLIRHKRRYEHFWQHIDYEAVKSNGVSEFLGNVNEQEFLLIVGKMLKGFTNKEIEDEHELPTGTASRIRHKKLYAFWWNKHFKDFDRVSREIKNSHNKKVKEVLFNSGTKVKGIKRSTVTKETMRKNNGKSVAVIIEDIKYSSMMQAEKETGINRKVIAKRITSNEYPTYVRVMNKIEKEQVVTERNERKSKPVRIDGKVYKSMSAASKELGINRKTIASRAKSPSFEKYELID